MARLTFDVFWRDHGAKAGLKGLSAEAKDAARKQAEFRRTASVAGAVVGAALFKLGKDSLAVASNMTEAQSKVQVVFGQSAAVINDLAKNSAKSMGISKRATLEAAGVFGNLFVSLKLPQAESARMSARMIQLASDMASFNDASPEEALAALRSGLVGEAEPLRRFGVNLTDATLRQKALEMGLISTTKDALTPAVKAQASYALILDQTKTAQGDFARTSENNANMQRKLRAQYEDMSAQVGEKLLPALVKITGTMSDLLTFVDKNARAFLPLATGIGAAAAAIFTINKAAAGLSATRAAFTHLNDAFSGLNKNQTDAKGSAGRFSSFMGAGGPWSLALIAGGIALGAWVKSQQDAKRRVEETTDSLDEQTGAITLNTRKVAYSALVNSGAVDAAKRLGVSLADLTDAALGDAQATERVNAALERARPRLDGAQAAASRGGAALDKYQTSSLRVKEAIGAQNDALRTARQRLADAAAAGLGTTSRTDDLNASLRTTAGRLGAASSAAKGFEVRLANLPSPRVTVSASVLLFGQNSFESRLAKLGRAQGGPISGPGTGTSDSIPAMLSAGEHVWTAREVAAAGGHGAVVGLRRAVMGGRFAGGGPVDSGPLNMRTVGRISGRIESLMEDVAQGASVLLMSSVRRAVNRATALGGGSLGGGGWRTQWAVLRSAFPGAQLFSAYRPGARTTSGAASYHSAGRAIDVTPSMGIFEWIRRNYGGSTRELIYSPAGARQIKNGRPYLYSGAVRAGHYSHVHWAYDQGGVATGAGWLAKMASAPERILSPGQTVAFDRLVRVAERGGGVGARVDQHFHFDRYIGSRDDLVRSINEAAAQGRLDYALRRAG